MSRHQPTAIEAASAMRWAQLVMQVWLRGSCTWALYPTAQAQLWHAQAQLMATTAANDEARSGPAAA